jgi:uncharacterized protein
MYKRLLKLTKSRSFFLFGARNTGKSTLVRHEFDQNTCLWIDLLDPLVESKYARNPAILKEEVAALDQATPYVVIDEVQKIPKLLDVVHMLIESTDNIFILTGSSARKLKQSGVNLLAGRAFVFNLYPLTSIEMGERFDLQSALSWGLLPEAQNLQTDEDRRHFLLSYTQTYLKEEIWAEHIINKLDPFRLFLEVAAQCSGKVLNIANIARDVGVDAKTVQNYFSILEDTLVGYSLPPYHASFRKRLSQKPKFYFLDMGVTRALAHLLSVAPRPQTSYYGELFEHFIILECRKLADYYQTDYRLSYLQTKDGAEIDLILDRPGKKPLFIEIKSTTELREDHLTSMKKLIREVECDAMCLSRDPIAKQFGVILAMPWQDGLKKIFEKHQAL